MLSQTATANLLKQVAAAASNLQTKTHAQFSFVSLHINFENRLHVLRCVDWQQNWGQWASQQAHVLIQVVGQSRHLWSHHQRRPRHQRTRAQAHVLDAKCIIRHLFWSLLVVLARRRDDLDTQNRWLLLLVGLDVPNQSTPFPLTIASDDDYANLLWERCLRDHLRQLPSSKRASKFHKRCTNTIRHMNGSEIATVKLLLIWFKSQNSNNNTISTGSTYFQTITVHFQCCRWSPPHADITQSRHEQTDDEYTHDRRAYRASSSLQW